MRARNDDLSNLSGRSTSNVQRFDSAGKLDTSVAVTSTDLATVLDSVRTLADSRGLSAHESADLIAMLTPQPEHVVAA